MPLYRKLLGVSAAAALPAFSSFLRACGDGPGKLVTHNTTRPFSPRMRGWARPPSPFSERRTH